LLVPVVAVQEGRAVPEWQMEVQAVWSQLECLLQQTFHHHLTQ
jgi:hypothetical protein